MVNPDQRENTPELEPKPTPMQQRIDAATEKCLHKLKYPIDPQSIAQFKKTVLGIMSIISEEVDGDFGNIRFPETLSLIEVKLHLCDPKDADGTRIESALNSILHPTRSNKSIYSYVPLRVLQDVCLMAAHGVESYEDIPQKPKITHLSSTFIQPSTRRKLRSGYYPKS